MALSNDPDADAVLGSFDHPEASHDSDAATVLASFDAPKASIAPPVKISSPAHVGSEGSTGEGGFGMAETALHLGSGYLGKLGGGLTYLGTLAATGGDTEAAKAVQEDTEKAITYQPRTEEGQEMTQGLGQLVEPVARYVGKGVDFLSSRAAEKHGPAAGAFEKTVLEGAPYILGIGPATRTAESAAQGLSGIGKAVNRIGLEPPAVISGSQQSMGAARTAPAIAQASAPLQQAVREASQRTGGAVNESVLENHLDADQHGIQLTEGQATRDPNTFSAEQNSTHPDIVARINQQEQQLTDALDNIRREAAPGAVQNNPIENGQIVVDRLKTYDEPIRAEINARYDAARKASATGDLNMDGSSFVRDANTALKPQSRFRFLPGTVRGILNDVDEASGRMTLDDYQAYETQIGNEIAKARASGDGNAVAAINQVRNALERVQPVGEETAQAKNLFDQARSTAKARFDEIDADPAYEAAVNDVKNGTRRGTPSTLADRFLDKYVLGTAPLANVNRLMAKLDPEATDAVVSHTLNQIRDRAITPNGKVSPHGFNSAMEKFDPKLDSLVSPGTRESLESYGRTLTNTKVPPPGHSVNYSKSGVIINAAQGTAQHLGEAAINAKTLGMGIPIIKGIAADRFARRVLAPGAGLTNLTSQ